MKPYLIMNEVTQVKVGERRDMLPLHSTLMHWFWLGDDMPAGELVDTLDDEFRRPVRLVPAGEAVFTAATNDGDMPVRVTTLERTNELMNLHERVHAALGVLGAVHEKPEYTLDGYHPHITHQQRESVDPAGYLSESLYVVTAERPEYGNSRYVLARVALRR